MSLFNKNKEKLLKATNFALFYGRGYLDELEQYDVAIVEPAAHSISDIKRLKEKGVLTIAYLSAMEFSAHSPLADCLKNEDYLKINEIKAYNKLYDNYYADLLSKRWRELFFYNLGRLVVSSGYDGIFLDTASYTESNEVFECWGNEQMYAYFDILREIKHSFPDCILIQNNGLEKIIMLASEYLDGVCWENPPFGINDCFLWVEEVIDRLKMLKARKNLRPFLLLEDKLNLIRTKRSYIDTAVRKAAGLYKKEKFLFYIAPESYVSGVNPADVMQRILQY